jgi:hypothetical protein
MIHVIEFHDTHFLRGKKKIKKREAAAVLVTGCGSP